MTCCKSCKTAVVIAHVTIMENSSGMPGCNQTADGSLPGGRYSIMEYWIVVTMLGFFAVAGVLGNALVLFVFFRKKDKLTSTLFILVLAMLDMVTCMVVIPSAIYIETKDFYVNNDAFCKIYFFLVASNVPFSALVMAAISLDRYFCICYPFRNIMTVGRARLVTIVLALVTASFGVIVGMSFGTFKRVPQFVEDHLTTYGELDCSNMSSMSVEAPRYSNNNSDLELTVIHTGRCLHNDIYISNGFRENFQMFHTMIYPFCLVVMIIVYSLIYRWVYQHRKKRMLQHRKSTAVTSSETATELTTMAPGAGAARNSVEVTRLSPQPPRSLDITPVAPTAGNGKEGGGPSHRRMSRRERMRVANLKTAMMLFVVTLVFVITYTPAFLIMIGFIDHSRIILFYLYYANNAANPIIYSFMNQNFRSDLRRIFSSDITPSVRYGRAA